MLRSVSASRWRQSHVGISLTAVAAAVVAAAEVGGGGIFLPRPLPVTTLVLDASLRRACVSHTGLWFLGPAASGKVAKVRLGVGVLDSTRSSAANSVGGPW